jgi:hypothetical protein
MNMSIRCRSRLTARKCSTFTKPKRERWLSWLHKIIESRVSFIATFLLCLAGNGQAADLLQPIQSSGKYTFAPNQLAAAEWYRPQGHVINGHIAESFAKTNLWPKIYDFLRGTHGSFGINAAEVGYLTADQLLGFRNAGIVISTEMPAWTQCFGGRVLGQAEFFGEPAGGQNLFQSVFHITTANGRPDPAGRGWFVTKDGQDYAPDEVVLDHRIPGLLPSFKGDALLASATGLTWEQRKARARTDPCPAADAFHPPSDRLTGLIQDYLDYARVMARRFPDKPAFSFHWNVHPGWEWGDEQCLDALQSLHPDPASFERAFRYLEKPCHRDTLILSRLLDVLCDAGACPGTVFMDIELNYQTGYALDVLRRNKDVLSKHGVSFGVDLSDECNERAMCLQVSRTPGHMSLEQEKVDDSKSENLLNRDSLVHKFEFLHANGIIDRDTHLRFESWSRRPIEQGPQVDEANPGSYANTMLHMICGVITPLGWIRVTKGGTICETGVNEKE